MLAVVAVIGGAAGATVDPCALLAVACHLLLAADISVIGGGGDAAVLGSCPLVGVRWKNCHLPG